MAIENDTNDKLITLDNLAVFQEEIDARKQDTLPSGSNGQYLSLENGGITWKTLPESAPLVSITYANLKTLRDNGTLVLGRQYRIIDYQCTTVQTNTSSAGHQFDIIVTADSANKLNEVARACLHSGDTYFASSKLEAWQIWYCIDNDTTRFAWADSTNGKGVIYRMIDEFNNDVPYDFKNILFTYSSETAEYTNAYTFSYTENSTIKDASLVGLSKSCYDNVMKEYIDSNKRQLNFNVFYSTSTSFDCYINTFGNNCHNNTFEYVCTYNKFEDDCSFNTLGHDCSFNTFGKSCYNNLFYDNCGSNTLGDDCLDNAFEDGSFYNILGYGCYENAFDRNCSSNTFGNECAANIFGNSCSRNTFGNNCCNNAFGNNCYHNTFDNECLSNTFGDNCFYNTFGNGCRNNTFGNYFDSNTFGILCRYVTFGNSSSTINYCEYIIIDNGCQYLYINSTDTSASASNSLQNFHVHLGVKGTSSSNRKMITIPDRNLSYETNVYMDASGNIEMVVNSGIVSAINANY